MQQNPQNKNAVQKLPTPISTTISTPIAAIDIGSNTIMMTMAVFNNGKGKAPTNMPHNANSKNNSKNNSLAHVKWQQNNWHYYDFIRFASLAEGMESSHSISAAAIKRSKAALKSYKNYLTMQEEQLSMHIPLKVAATCAMREAKNQSVVKEQLEEVIQTNIEILSGKEEGRLTFLGSAANNSDNLALIDIGGGSTEIILAPNGTYSECISLPIGAVRWLKRYNQQTLANSAVTQKAVTEIEHIFNKATNHLSPSLIKALTPCTFRAVAGVPTTLAAVQHKLPLQKFFLLEDKPLTFTQIATIKDALLSTKISTVINSKTTWQAIDKKRAPIMPISCIIFYTLLCCLQRKLGGEEKLNVSVKGLRYGLLEELIKN